MIFHPVPPDERHEAPFERGEREEADQGGYHNQHEGRQPIGDGRVEKEKMIDENNHMGRKRHGGPGRSQIGAHDVPILAAIFAILNGFQIALKQSSLCAARTFQYGPSAEGGPNPVGETINGVCLSHKMDIGVWAYLRQSLFKAAAI